MMTMNEKTLARKNAFDKMEEDADKKISDGNLKEGLNKYYVLLDYYNTLKNIQKEKAIAKKMIILYTHIAQKNLDDESKIEKRSIQPIKKSVANLLDALNLSYKYGFDVTADKIYKKAIRICHANGLYNYEKDIEEIWKKHAENKYETKKNNYF